MKKNLEELKKDIVFDAVVKDRNFTFHSTWGLFSPARIDDGSKLLLEYMEVAPDASVLDIGCGYGALGIPLAARVPQGRVTMTDKDFVAVEYAKKNVKFAGLKNCEVYLSNLMSHVPEEEKFDVIVSNVPAKGERELYDVFLRGAYDHLKSGGQLYLVSISGLREFFKKNMQEVFGNYEKVKQGGTYTVGKAVKQGT